MNLFFGMEKEDVQKYSRIKNVNLNEKKPLSRHDVLMASAEVITDDIMEGVLQEGSQLANAFSIFSAKLVAKLFDNDKEKR